jgi:hypothetical protein
MQRLMMICGVVLLSAFTLTGVGAVSVSASGHEFITSKTGKTKSKGINTQKFKTGAGTIECTTVTGSGEVKEPTKMAAHKEVLTYSGCIGFGVSLKVTPAHFEFNANGFAKLENQVVVSSASLTCEVLIEPQTLETIAYANESGKVKATANVSKIQSIGTGGTCGGENNEGSYTGSILGELESGTVEWK